jgi:hypothetical protein
VQKTFLDGHRKEYRQSIRRRHVLGTPRIVFVEA